MACFRTPPPEYTLPNRVRLGFPIFFWGGEGTTEYTFPCFLFLFLHKELTAEACLLQFYTTALLLAAFGGYRSDEGRIVRRFISRGLRIVRIY